METKTRLGLSKLAQDDPTVVPPEGQSDNTVVTCMSDCMYAQNPEKTCMLKNISLAMGESGEFSCGQYAPAQQMQPGMPGMAAPGQAPAPAAPAQPQQLGLSKTKKPSEKSSDKPSQQ